MSVAKVCKFQKERLEISYDCGETFEPTSETRKIEGREPVERNSTDCGFQISRMTVESGHTCNGYHKYTQLVDKVSYDGEQTWDIIEGSNRIGALSERWSPDCCQLRTVSGTVCTEMFRKANVDIQEASLDGEHWIRTGKYTVNEYLDEYNIECMNQYGVKFLGVPVSGASGLSYFDYEMYTTSVSSSALTAVGADENYYIIGCSSSSNTFGWSSNDSIQFGEEIINSLNNIKYIFINDCAVNPVISRFYYKFGNSYSGTSYSSLEKIFISSGVSGDFGTDTYYTDYNNLSGSTALTEVVGLGESRIMSIQEYMFADCTSLKTIHIPETCTYIGIGAFRGCTSLSSVTIDAKYLQEIGGTSGLANQFAGCTSLETVTFPNDYYGGIQNGMFQGCTSLTAATLGNPSYIGSSTFSGCTSLSSITLGNRVERIADRAFYECSSLKDVYIGQKSNILANVKNTSFPSGVTIHVPCEAYGYWHQAAEIDHPEVGWTIAIWGDTGCVETQWVVSGTTCIGYDKYSLLVEERSYDGGSTWYPSGSQSAGTLIEADSIDCGYVPVITDKVYVIYSDSSTAATECSSVGTAQTVTSGDVRFNGSIGYTTCFIGDCDATTTTLQNRLFASASSLREIFLPSSVKRIPDGCFDFCSNLTNVHINGDITEIAPSAFQNCTSLTSITIPASVTNIGFYAFRSSGLVELTCLATTPPTFGTQAFPSTLNVIYVPSGSVEAYKESWAYYENKIQAIPNS